MSGNEIVFRPLSPTSALALEQLARSLGLSVDPMRELELPQSRCLLAFAGDRLIGFTLAWQVGDEIEILDIGVEPAFRRRGIAGELLERVLAAGGQTQSFLEVREGNVGARTLYERHGFIESFRRRNYYADGETAVVYVRETP